MGTIHIDFGASGKLGVVHARPYESCVAYKLTADFLTWINDG
jgi:hypothetical protein